MLKTFVLLHPFQFDVLKRNVHENLYKLNLLYCGDIILLNIKINEENTETINI